MDVFDLFAKISLDTSEYKEGMESASNDSSSFASKLGSGLKTAAEVSAVALATAGAAVVGVSKSFVNSTSELAQYGDAIDKNSQKMGVSSKFYQEWDAVLQHSGTSMDSMSSTFKTLAKASQDASSDQQEAFAKLGLSMEQVSSMSSEELFSRVIAGLQGMEEGTERTALATTLLGRGSMEMGALLNTSAEDTQKMIDTVNELGGVMSDDAIKASAKYQDSLQDMQTAFAGAKNQIVSNFLPAMSTVMDGLTQLFSGDSQGISTIKEGILSIEKNVKEQIPVINKTISEIMPLIAETLVESLPILVNTAFTVVESFANGIFENLPQLLETCIQLVEMLANGIIQNLPMILNTSLEIIVTLANGIATSLPTLIPSIVDTILFIVDKFIDNVDKLIDASISIIIALSDGLIKAVPKLIEKAPTIIIKLVDAFVKNAPKLLTASVEVIKTIANGLILNVPTLIAKIPEIVTHLKNKFIELVKSFADVGKNIVNGIWEGLKSAWSGLINKAGELVNGLVGGVKDILGIHSPSKVFAQIGGYMADGLSEGWESEFDKVNKSINDGMTFDASINTISSTSAVESRVEMILTAILEALEGMDITIDGKALVGKIAPQMNKELGRIASREGRYA